MRNVFLILGYGIPKDILKDENYKTYLKLVFNGIYSLVLAKNIRKPLIVFSGGKTDIYKPYKRDEASEMIRYFKTLMNRKDIEDKLKNWQIVNDSRALSTLENILYTKELLSKKGINKAEITVFCEATRIKKVKVFAIKVFGRNFTVKVRSIDFDVSPSRYLEIDFIEEKETQDIKFGLWALQSKDNFKKYHQVFVDRIEYFRKQGPKKHLKSIHEWWDQELNKLTD